MAQKTCLVQIIGKLSFAESSIENIVIPSNVTKICQKAFYKCKKLKIFAFESNSKIITIGKDAFRESSIDELLIPSSVRKLKSNCFSFLQFKNFSISNCSEKNICIYDNKYIIGKSNIYMDTYDVLYFSSFNNECNTIPSFIKRIESCYIFRISDLFEFPENSELRFISNELIDLNLEKIKIPSSDNSKLEEFHQMSFFNCGIESLIIPSTVTIIDNYSFLSCIHLNKILIKDDSKLKIIGAEAFKNTAITSMFLPKHVINIGECAFDACKKLQIIELNDNFKKIDLEIIQSFVNESYNGIIMIPSI